MIEPFESKVLPSTPVDRFRLLGVFALFAAGFGYVAVGLAYRQLVQTHDLKDQADTQSRRLLMRPPARGQIFDRHGTVLADNRARWSVKADLAALEKEFRGEYRRLMARERARQAVRIDADRIMELARVNVLQGWLDKVWFVIDANTRPAASRVRPGPGEARGERDINLEALRRHLRDRRSMPLTLIEDLALLGSPEATSPPVGEKAVARFIEQFPVEGPIRLESDIIRTYPFGSLAAHVLGYVRDTDMLPPVVTDSDDVRSANLQKLRLTGKTGAAGIELSYDDSLRGLTGWELWTKTSSGYNHTMLKYSVPEQGSQITLSLDVNLQRTGEDALAKLRDSQGNLLPAAAVMIDVNTGEILVMASQPTFDPNRLAGRISTADYEEIERRGAWLNRATQGLYAPGSTFKMITAMAGMRKRVVDWDDIIECGAFFKVGNRNFPEHEPVGYGAVDVDKMLAISCNVWNYQIGLRAGPEALAAEARRFGLDSPLLENTSRSGDASQPVTELPYAASSGLVVPDRDYKTRINAGPWTDGDTANYSIGQGFLLTTPLHMACFSASLARGQTRTTPTIIHDPRRDGQHRGAQPIGLSAPQLEALHGGMVRCVDEGTGKTARIPGLPIAGKTGTTEYFKRGEKAHLAWMIGYAPADNPVVAFAVLVEGQADTNTWGGKTAGPIVKELLEAWATPAPPGSVR